MMKKVYNKIKIKINQSVLALKIKYFRKMKLRILDDYAELFTLIHLSKL